MSAPYFIVHAVKTEGGVVLVDGRLCAGVLKRNHLFSHSFVSTDARQKREEGLPCALVVQDIEAYRHKLDELSSGMTARLSLIGRHLSAVRPNSVIE
jgi:hypothetical protein